MHVPAAVAIVAKANTHAVPSQARLVHANVRAVPQENAAIPRPQLARLSRRNIAADHRQLMELYKFHTQRALLISGALAAPPGKIPGGMKRRVQSAKWKVEGLWMLSACKSRKNEIGEQDRKVSVPKW